MNDQNQIEEIKFNKNNLWKEENFTDLEVGTIRKLTPIKTDGSNDNERKPTFTATTNIMTQMAPFHYPEKLKRQHLRKLFQIFRMQLMKLLKNFRMI